LKLVEAEVKDALGRGNSNTIVADFGVLADLHCERLPQYLRKAFQSGGPIAYRAVQFVTLQDDRAWCPEVHDWLHDECDRISRARLRNACTEFLKRHHFRPAARKAAVLSTRRRGGRVAKAK
jgi:hypothetical protein